MTLSEQMGAMALIDDLRHRQMVVQEHLDLPERRREVARRIRDYYQSRNIAVDEALVDQGVREFFARRLSFEAPELGGAAALLARLHITRERWSKPAAIAILTLAVVAGGGYKAYDAYDTSVTAKAEALSGRQNVLMAKFRGMGLRPEEMQQVEAIAATATAAIQARDATSAEKALGELARVLAYAEMPLTLNIVDRAGVKSGVERNYRGSGGKSWFLIVEATDPSGRVMPVPVTSVETGVTAQATIFGVRVAQAEYERTKADKNADGHVDDRAIGQKPARSLTLQFNNRTSAKPDMILEW